MLSLFKTTGGVSEISDDESFSNPILWEVQTTGSVLQRKYYLRMDSPSTEYCTPATLSAIDAGGTDESSWYQFAPDVAGSPGTYSDTFEFELDINDEVPVWIKVTVPAAMADDPKDDISVVCTYTRHII